MRPQTFLFAAVLMLAALAAPRLAMAQYSNFPHGHDDNPNGPTVSPYLNLLQGNNQFNQVPTYQSLVKPLIDQRSALQQQGNSLQKLQNQVNTQGISGRTSKAGTGHVTHFMNYSHFYQAHK